MLSDILDKLLGRFFGPKPAFEKGQIVKTKEHDVRGVIFKIDRRFSQPPALLEAIPEEKRPQKDQPFYWLYAENDITYYETYVSEQSLVIDKSGLPVDHPDVEATFDGERYRFRRNLRFW